MTSHEALNAYSVDRPTLHHSRERTGAPNPDAATRLEASVGISLVLRTDAPHFTVIAVSDACAAAMNRQPADVVGAPFIRLFFDGQIAERPDQLEALLTSFRRVMQGRDMEATCIQQLDLAGPGGAAGERSRWMNVRTSPVFAADQSVCYLLVQLESATAEIQHARANESDPWLSLLAHEMLQPLNAISNHADRLAKEDFAAGNEAVVKMYVEHIRRASSLLTGMLEDVLDTCARTSRHSASR